MIWLYSFLLEEADKGKESYIKFFLEQKKHYSNKKFLSEFYEMSEENFQKNLDNFIKVLDSEKITEGSFLENTKTIVTQLLKKKEKKIDFFLAKFNFELKKEGFNKENFLLKSCIHEMLVEERKKMFPILSFEKIQGTQKKICECFWIPESFFLELPTSVQFKLEDFRKLGFFEKVFRFFKAIIMKILELFKMIIMKILELFKTIIMKIVGFFKMIIMKILGFFKMIIMKILGFFKTIIMKFLRFFQNMKIFIFFKVILNDFRKLFISFQTTLNNLIFQKLQYHFKKEPFLTTLLVLLFFILVKILFNFFKLFFISREKKKDTDEKMEINSNQKIREEKVEIKENEEKDNLIPKPNPEKKRKIEKPVLNEEEYIHPNE